MAQTLPVPAHPTDQGPVRPDGAERVGVGPRVAIVTPCFNRPQDLRQLYEDLAAMPSGGDGSVRVFVIDNCSDEPIEAACPMPESIDGRVIRLDSNTGGSGGYNAGMRAALAYAWPDGRTADYLWLVDSDARVRPDTLAKLLAVIESRPDLVAVGPALEDPNTGEVFEVGGRVSRRLGWFEPAARGTAGLPDLVRCEYVAACCALVRADAARRVGLFPDLFLNADDVTWFIELARQTGKGVAAVTAARASHPVFNRFETWSRYFIARNALAPVQALGLSPVVRFRRAGREALRATQQRMMGRGDLARMHIDGLRDAIRGRTRGMPARGMPRAEAFRPWDELPAALAQLRVGVRRAGARVEANAAALHPDGADGLKRALREGGVADRASGRLRGVGVVMARGRPPSWVAGAALIAADRRGFWVRPERPVRSAIAAGVVGLRAGSLATRAALFGVKYPGLDGASTETGRG